MDIPRSRIVVNPYLARRSDQISTAKFRISTGTNVATHLQARYMFLALRDDDHRVRGASHDFPGLFKTVTG